MQGQKKRSCHLQKFQRLNKKAAKTSWVLFFCFLAHGKSFMVILVKEWFSFLFFERICFRTCFYVSTWSYLLKMAWKWDLVIFYDSLWRDVSKTYVFESFSPRERPPQRSLDPEFGLIEQTAVFYAIDAYRSIGCRRHI